MLDRAPESSRLVEGHEARVRARAGREVREGRMEERCARMMRRSETKGGERVVVRDGTRQAMLARASPRGRHTRSAQDQDVPPELQRPHRYLPGPA